MSRIKNFKKLVETRWSFELASLANKDLQEKKWNKPLLLPLVSDVKTFRDEVLKMANECCDIFKQNHTDVTSFQPPPFSLLALLKYHFRVSHEVETLTEIPVHSPLFSANPEDSCD
ncbi:hypothetical protein QE152_g9628 [Popillia japonica]|uniref:Uncharacterized protein n=1 Tax=Popillia japonica TaxID=7064 RepID=A0AAW1LXP4_POPJA